MVTLQPALGAAQDLATSEGGLAQDASHGVDGCKVCMDGGVTASV